MPSDATNADTIAEWRELGFFYDLDQSQKRWRVVGSKSGLTGFADLIGEYAADPRKGMISEHEHYGPYMYLEIQTANGPGMDEHSIYGSLPDLGRLAQLIRLKVSRAQPGEVIKVGAEYSQASDYCLILEVREDGFDPASVDPQLP